MKKILLLVALIFSFALDANAVDLNSLSFGFLGSGGKNANKAGTDETADTMCKIVNYTHTIGGPMITVVVIGAALLAIFGRMPWPALFALGAFTAVFFGAPSVVKVVAPNGLMCDGDKATTN